MLDLAAIAKQLPPDLFHPAPLAIRQSDKDGIRIEYRYQEFKADGETGRFWGGVRAFYGPTILECDELSIDYKEKVGHAKGKVRITDPEGTLEGVDLEFNWVAQTGSASDVHMRVAGVRLDITRLEIGPKQWIATGVKGTPSKMHPPEFEFGAEKLFLRPGRTGKAIKPNFSVFGAKFLQIPAYSFSLNRSVTGLRLPGISYRQGSGIGASWSSSFILGDRSGLGAGFKVYRNAYPSFHLEFNQAPRSADLSGGRLGTRSDLRDRFADSWFDSILVRNRVAELDSLRPSREVYSVGSYWGESTSGRKTDGERISKPLDIAYEVSGGLGAWVGLAQTRLQRIQGGPHETPLNRGVVQLTARHEPIPLAKSISLVFGVDAGSTVDHQRTYAWTRGMSFLLVDPDRHVSFAFGRVFAADAGKLRFPWDENQMADAYHARADLDFGNIKAGVLVKYDIRQQRWYDVEYGASFVAGSFEPYFLYRQSPRDIQFGARLRLDEFVDLLTRKNFRRDEDKGKGADTRPAP